MGMKFLASIFGANLTQGMPFLQYMVFPRLVPNKFRAIARNHRLNAPSSKRLLKH